MYKTVAFDLDGTLVDSIFDIAACMNHTFEKHGFPTYTVDEYRKLVGSGIRTIAEKTLPDEPEEVITELCNDYEPYYIEHNTDHTVIYDGVPEMLAKLRNNGVAVAVLSNKPHNQAVSVVEKLFGKGVFDCVWGRKEEFPLKPDPTSFYAMLEHMGAERQSCVYVGDSELDISLAENAGVDGVGVTWGIMGKNSFTEVIPKLRADSVAQLEELILKDVDKTEY